MWDINSMFTLLVILLASAQKCNFEQVLIAVACEDHIFYANCHTPFQVINIVKAIFGRFSLRPCIGNTDLANLNKNYLPYDQMDLQCSATNTTDIVKERCNNHQRCMLEASTLVFGEPCAGTYKYLEIHYKCIDKENKVASVPEGEDEFEEFENESSNAKRIITTSLPTSNLFNNSGTIPVASMTFPSSPCCDDEMNNDILSNQNGTSQPPQISTTCSQRYVREITWPQTEIGVSLQQQCPNNANGFARWYCSSNGEWYPKYPDLSECTSHWSIELENKVNNVTSFKVLSSSLYNATRKNIIFGGDIKRVVKLISLISSDTNSHEHTQDASLIARNLLGSSDCLLSEAAMTSWQDLSVKEQRKSATILLRNVENVGKFLLKSFSHSNNSFTSPSASDQFFYDSPNLVLKVAEVGDKFGVEIDGYHMSFRGDSQRSQKKLSHKSSEKIFIKSVFYSTKYSIALLEGNLKFLLVDDEKKSENGANMSVDDNHVVTRIVSITKLTTGPNLPLLMNSSAESNLSNAIVLLTFPLAKDPLKNNVPKCVFYQYNSNYLDGNWSGQGCWVHTYTDKFVTCACNHMTSFAVILDVVGIEIPLPHERALIIITQVGCIISIFSLLICVISFHCLRNVLNERMTIHKHLCLTLVIAEILFVAGIQSTSLKIGCSIVALLLHYFFLCAFMWMLVEGLQLYTMLVEVFEPEKSRLKYYTSMAYGIPFIIVLISYIVYPQGYGNSNHCWLSTDDYFIFSFVGPVITILIANFIFLGIALYIMGRHFTMMPNHNDKSKLVKMKTWLKGAFILIFLMGLTWFFGLLFINKETIFAAYLFTILNSFQGLFIFVFHCLLNDKVVKEYRKLLHRSPLVPFWLKTYVTATTSMAGSSVALTKSSNKNSSDNHHKAKLYSNLDGHNGFEKRDNHYGRMGKQAIQLDSLSIPFKFFISPFLNSNPFLQKKAKLIDGINIREGSHMNDKNLQPYCRPSFLPSQDFVQFRNSDSLSENTLMPQVYEVPGLKISNSLEKGNMKTLSTDDSPFPLNDVSNLPFKFISEVVLKNFQDLDYTHNSFSCVGDERNFFLNLPTTNLDDLSSSSTTSTKSSAHFNGSHLAPTLLLQDDPLENKPLRGVLPFFRNAKSEDLSQPEPALTFDLNNLEQSGKEDETVSFNSETILTPIYQRFHTSTKASLIHKSFSFNPLPTTNIFSEKRFSGYGKDMNHNGTCHYINQASDGKDSNVLTFNDKATLLLPTNVSKFKAQGGPL